MRTESRTETRAETRSERAAKAEKLALDLQKMGLRPNEILAHNLSYDELFIHETEALEKGGLSLTQLGAVAIPAVFPFEKRPFYIVHEEQSAGQIWWAHAGSNQHPIPEEQWQDIRSEAFASLNQDSLYVMDVYVGASEKSRLALRFISPMPWRAHFVKNMFLRPASEESQNFRADWTILDLCGKKLPTALLAEEAGCALTAISENLSLLFGERDDALIRDTVFALMSYRLPERGVALLASSANQAIDTGDCALFLGGPGSGKSTLAQDPTRLLIGDDEHYWDSHGISSLEGGVYSSFRDLSSDLRRVVRKNALLETLLNSEKEGEKAAEESWVSYPMSHRQQAVRPLPQGKEPAQIIILIHDSLGVFPPLAKLSQEQALYFYLSGYGAAAAEHGRPGEFSACFRAGALILPPLRYAELLAQRMARAGTRCYLLNTGYSGPEAQQKISPEFSRRLLADIFSGAVDEAELSRETIFDLEVPNALPSTSSVDLRCRWNDRRQQLSHERYLAGLFVDQFQRYANYPLGRKLLSAGPLLGSRI